MTTCQITIHLISGAVRVFHDSLEICVECDVNGNPPRLLVLPDNDDSNMVTTALSMTEGDEGDLGPPEEQRSKRSRVFSFFKDKKRTGSE